MLNNSSTSLRSVASKWCNMKSVIFDLDGTLVDTSGDLVAAANACFVSMGEAPQLDPKTDASTAFLGTLAMLELGFSRLGYMPEAEKMQNYYDYLSDFYGENIDCHTYLYDGVRDCLDGLKARGYLMGICTNKRIKFAEKLTSRMGIRHYFQAVVGADTLPVRKPDAGHLLGTIKALNGNPSKSMMIGDTITDRNAAKNAGVPCVLVTFGPDGAKVADLKPEGLLDHFDQLPDMMDTMIKG